LKEKKRKDDLFLLGTASWHSEALERLCAKKCKGDGDILQKAVKEYVEQFVL